MTLKVMTVVIFLFLAGQSQAQDVRRALIIGNDSYPGNALQNARNDAESVAIALQRVGYITTLVLDADRNGFLTRINQFADELNLGDTVIVYYAGHGLQVAGENYLVPIDFTVTTSENVKYTGISLSYLIDRLTSHGATTEIVILDACRDNPFLGNRSIAGGWASLGASAGTLLVFGTSVGSTASDEPNQPHGRFTQSLLKYLTSSQLDIESMLREVRFDVIRESHGQQVPWTSSSLVGSFHVVPGLDQSPQQHQSAPLPDAGPLGAKAMGERSIQASGFDQAPTVERLPDGGLSHSDVSLLMEQATRQIKSGLFEAAVSTLQAVVSLVPGYSLAYRILGLVLTLLGRDVDAGRAFDRALTIDTGDRSALVERCIIDSSLDSLSTASDCNAALRMDDRDADVHLALANALFLKGKISQAYSELSKSMELCPDQELAFVLRGRIAATMGKKDIAEQDYRRAVRLALAEENLFH